MPFRLSIPLPGPFSWSPSRRRRGRARPSAPLLTADEARATAEAATRALGRGVERMDASAARMDERRAAGQGRHAERMAELRARRNLPWRDRLRASFGLRP